MALFNRIALALAGTLAAATAALAAAPHETVVVRGVAGPEGPLVVDGALYYVGWNDDALSKWDGHRTTVVHRLKGCSHNGLALTKAKTFLLACSSDPGAILELTLDGKELRRWDTDETGAKITGGINDIATAPNGGAYATVFGPYDGVAPPTAVIGKVLYLAPRASAWKVVARDLNYANGVGVSPDGKTLYVSEMGAGLVLKFAIEADGGLSHRANFAQLDSLIERDSRSPWLGPDSLKLDRKGDVYVAQFFGGRVLKLSPQGKLLQVFKIAAGDGTTNVALDAGERHLYVSVVKSAKDPKAKGSIVRVDNVR